jgi:hypothetical protein
MRYVGMDGRKKKKKEKKGKEKGKKTTGWIRTGD